MSEPRSRSRSAAEWWSTCGVARRPSTGPTTTMRACRASRATGSEDTIINVWSTTKTMAALVCLVLADRGELDLYEPIATYWPEFAANGKEQIATRHVLAHTAGLVGLGRTARRDRLLRPRQARPAPRRPGAVVGTGHPIRLPRRSPRGTCSARSSSVSTVAHSARSSPRRSPDRSAPTSTSAHLPSATPGSRGSSRRRARSSR